MRSKYYNFSIFCLFCILCLQSANNVSAKPNYYTSRDDVQAWIDQVSLEKNIPKEYLTTNMAAAERRPSIEKIVRQVPSSTPPVKSWSSYRARIIDPIRIDKGLQFWSTHEKTIQAAADRYGVPPSVIVAIIGVETLYGENMGNFRVIDALSTLGFNYPPENTRDRSEFFQKELVAFLELCYQQKVNPLSIKGSYAGAIGYSQFMPSSIIAYAEDGNGNSKVNLTTEVEDAIWSTARFLSLHGWVANTPIYAPVQLPANSEKIAALVDGGITAKRSWTELNQAGIQPLESGSISATAPSSHWSHLSMGVIDLPDTPLNKVEYRVALPNYFAITNYNRSYFYASSVTELADILQTRKVARK